MMVRVYSDYTDVENAMTPPSTTVDRPNQPASFTDVLFEHDSGSFPTPGESDVFPASGSGRIDVFSSSWDEDGNDEGTFTGAIPSSSFVMGPRPHDGVPTVTHGPINPHGRQFVHRVRYSQGTIGSSGATGGGSQCSFVDSGGLGTEYQAVYIHFWLLMEGAHYNSPVDGPTRVVLTGSQYRMAFQRNICPNSTNHGGLIGVGNSSGALMRGRNAETGVVEQVVSDNGKLTDTGFFVGMGTAQLGSGRQGHPGDPNSVGNYNSGGNRAWYLTDGGNNVILNSDTRTPSTLIQVGRWHRVEIILIHSDTNTMNGSLRLHIDGNTTPAAIASPITTRWTDVQGPDGCGPAVGWYHYQRWYRGWHPSGSARVPFYRDLCGTHGRYASYADYFMAGIKN